MCKLGNPAKKSYIKKEDCMRMPHLDDGGGGGGTTAEEPVQSTLVDFGEPMIGNKTHSEILAMSKQQRYRWYKTISADEKTEAMKILDISLRAKRSVNTKKRWKNPESRARISEGLKRYWEDSENRAKRSAMMSGENNPAKRPEVRAKRSGENHPAKRPEARARVSKWSKKQWEDSEHKKRTSESLKVVWSRPERRAMTSGENSPSKRPEVRAKISASKKGKYTGSNAPNWQGGISFEPYCHLFNEAKREETRNRDGRFCQLCGKSEILNGRRLLVHHINSDKMQGCHGKKWGLVALCISCNSKRDTVEKEFLIVTNLSPIRGRSGL